MELQRFLVGVTCLVAVLGSVSGGPSAERRYKADPKSRFMIVKRNTGDSGDIPSGHQEPVDLHNKEFCVDVSFLKPVVWEEREGEECKTEFVKTCEEKRENVCNDVVETKCEVVAYPECKMGMEEQTASQTKLAPKLFVEKSCKTGTKTVPHTKMVPECKNVTKQNCVTLWERDEEGNPVWAGKEGCEPVTWQECKLVPKIVQFLVPEVNCTDKQELWFHEPEPETFTQMTNTFTCEIKNTTNCVTKPRADCKYVKWDECREEPVTTCNPKLVHVPVQEKVHRKKCLLPDNDIKPSYGAPQAPPRTEQATYSGSG